MRLNRELEWSSFRMNCNKLLRGLSSCREGSDSLRLLIPPIQGEDMGLILGMLEEPPTAEQVHTEVQKAP